MPRVDELNYFIPMLMIMNSSVNPLIYAIFSSKFRKRMRALLCCCRVAHKTKQSSGDASPAVSSAMGEEGS